ncbi:hypothetical protein QJS66_20935 [Kocuria rhizophila]|nr:hypothetical protein QJS66_20935 [Kocuria rhizophila]
MKVQSERDRWRQWATTLEQPAVSDHAETLRAHHHFRRPSRAWPSPWRARSPRPGWRPPPSTSCR